MKKVLVLYLVLLSAMVTNTMGIFSCKSKPDDAPNEKEKYEELYSRTVEVEQEIIALMRKAKESYADHSDEVALMYTNISALYKLTESLEGTDFILSQWDILLDEVEHTLLIVKYFKLWKSQGSLPEKTIAIGVGNVRLAIQNILTAEKMLIKNQQ